MLARWYLLLGQFSVTFEYRPGSQHANADGMSHQCGQCQRPDCPVSAKDSPVSENNQEIEMVDQPFAASEIVESMNADLLPELSGETVQGWIQSNSTLTSSDCAGLSPELRCWRLHNWKSVHRYRWPVMATSSSAGGGLTTGGLPQGETSDDPPVPRFIVRRTFRYF